MNDLEKAIQRAAEQIAADSKRLCQNKIYLTEEWVRNILEEELGVSRPSMKPVENTGSMVVY